MTASLNNEATVGGEDGSLEAWLEWQLSESSIAKYMPDHPYSLGYQEGFDYGIAFSLGIEMTPELEEKIRPNHHLRETNYDYGSQYGQGFVAALGEMRDWRFAEGAKEGIVRSWGIKLKPWHPYKTLTDGLVAVLLVIAAGSLLSVMAAAMSLFG